MTEDRDLPIGNLLHLASGSWVPLADLVRRVAQQPEVWIRAVTAAVGLPADASILDLEVDDIEAARDRLRGMRDSLDPQVALLANILIITVGVANDRLLTSASIAEVEYAITALTAALPPSWDSVLDQALTSPVLDPPTDRFAARHVV